MNQEYADNTFTNQNLRISLPQNVPSNPGKIHLFFYKKIIEIQKGQQFLSPNSFNDILKFDMNQRFSINRQNLNNFMIQANHVKDLPINMKIFKSYFKVPFEIFPESKEINEIFSKIVQR